MLYTFSATELLSEQEDSFDSAFNLAELYSCFLQISVNLFAALPSARLRESLASIQKMLNRFYGLPKISETTTIAVFLIVWLALWLPFAVWGTKKLHWRPFQPSSPAQKLPLLAALYLIAPLVLGMICWLEGTTLAAYGVPLQAGLLLSMLAGLAAGSLGLMAMFWLQSLLGWLTWVAPRSTQDSTHSATKQTQFSDAVKQGLLLLVLGLWVGWTEELVFRGFLQTQLEQEGSAWATAAAISFGFALLHWVWEGRAVALQLPGLWLMGMVLVLARQVDQSNIGLAWGLHAGWVWTIASLETLQMIRYTDKVPMWLTGHDAKPLAGAIGLGFLLLTAGTLWAIGG